MKASSLFIFTLLAAALVAPACIAERPANGRAANAATGQDDRRPAAETTDASLEQFDPVEQRIARNIHGTLATITEAALTEQQFRSVVQRLSKRDRDRIGDFADREFAELDARIARLKEIWRDRYGQEFALDQRELVYHPDTVLLVYGWSEEAQLARTERPREVQVRHEAAIGRRGNGDREQEEDERHRQPANQADDDRADKRNSNKDYDPDDPERYATVRIPASDFLPEMSVPMVNEGTIMDAWRIDAPTHLDGPRLAHNLNKQLGWATERQQEWPAGVNEAYLMITHHVLAAVMDVPEEQIASHQQAGQDKTEQEKDER